MLFLFFTVFLLAREISGSNGGNSLTVKFIYPNNYYVKIQNFIRLRMYATGGEILF